MKKIKHINIAPDLNNMLACIIFEDESKLSVTVQVCDKTFNEGRISADSILAAIESQMGLPNGLLAGSKVNQFCEEVNRVLDGDDRYIVTGDHPTLARPDKSNLTASQAQQYAFELTVAGFENVTSKRCN